MIVNRKMTNDSLATKLDSLKTEAKTNLIHFLGKPLYDILEGGEFKADMPFDVTGKFDIYDKSYNLQKYLGKDYNLNFDYNKEDSTGIRELFRLKLTKDF